MYFDRCPIPPYCMRIHPRPGGHLAPVCCGVWITSNNTILLAFYLPLDSLERVPRYSLLTTHVFSTYNQRTMSQPCFRSDTVPNSDARMQMPRYRACMSRLCHETLQRRLRPHSARIESRAACLSLAMLATPAPDVSPSVCIFIVPLGSRIVCPATGGTPIVATRTSV